MSLEAKEQLRSDFLAQRNHIPSKDIMEWSEVLTKHIISYFLPSPHKHWALYNALPSEVQTNTLCDLLRQNNALCLLPKIQSSSQPLRFHRFDNGDALTKHPDFHVLEPSEHSDMLSPHIIITPLVAFDRSGNRLGFGGGFYDRTLSYYRASNAQLVVIGIAFSLQEAQSIPTEIHDEKLDYIVTEQEVIKIT